VKEHEREVALHQVGLFGVELDGLPELEKTLQPVAKITTFHGKTSEAQATIAASPNATQTNPESTPPDECPAWNVRRERVERGAVELGRAVRVQFCDCADEGKAGERRGMVTPPSDLRP
jgi:hypothetical protein